MSTLIQRLLDRSVAAAPTTPSVLSAVPSVSPMADFDQRLQGGHFPDLPGLPSEQATADATEAPSSEFLKAPGAPVAVSQAVPSAPACQVPSRPDVPVREPQPDMLGRAAGATPRVAMSEAAPSQPLETAPQPVQTKAPPTTTLQSDRPKTRSAEPLEPVAALPASIAANGLPLAVAAEPQQSAPSETPSLVPTLLAVPAGEAPQVNTAWPTSDSPGPQPAEVPAPPPPDSKPPDPIPQAAPTPLVQPAVPMRPDPLPPPADPPIPQVRKERVIERVVREVPLAKDNSPLQRVPMTAESISKIGPLSDRRRAFTLFGHRRR